MFSKCRRIVLAVYYPPRTIEPRRRFSSSFFLFDSLSLLINSVEGDFVGHHWQVGVAESYRSCVPYGCSRQTICIIKGHGWACFWDNCFRRLVKDEATEEGSFDVSDAGACLTRPMETVLEMTTLSIVSVWDLLMVIEFVPKIRGNKLWNVPVARFFAFLSIIFERGVDRRGFSCCAYKLDFGARKVFNSGCSDVGTFLHGRLSCSAWMRHSSCAHSMFYYRRPSVWHFPQRDKYVPCALGRKMRLAGVWLTKQWTFVS